MIQVPPPSPPDPKSFIPDSKRILSLNPINYLIQDCHLANLAADFYGFVLQMAGGPEDTIEVEFYDPDLSTAITHKQSFLNILMTGFARRGGSST